MDTTSTTTSAGSTGDGGTAPATTVGDARASLALADSSPVTPESTADASAPSQAAATVQPDATPETPESGTTKPKGEPPAWRWQDILENTRTTVAKETEERIRKEVEAQYAGFGDLTSLNADQRAGLVVWQRAIDGDPAARARVAQAAQTNPQLAQALKSLIASEASAQPDAEPQPDYELPIRNADGQVVGYEPMYSAKQQAKRDAWREQQWNATLDKRLGPLQQVAQTFQQREAEAAYATTLSSVVASMTAADPVFAEHKADVSKALQEDARLMTLALGDDRTAPDPAMALEIAWGRVYRTKVLPAKQSQAEAQVVASLQQRAVAGTTNPATATSATPTSMLGNARAALEHAYAVTGSGT
jgi:hypothetical protein